MQYPTISEYAKAIQDAGANLNELAHLTPVLDDHGEPYHISGDFFVVFKMQDKNTGKCYALKCFTEKQEVRAEAYRQIANERSGVARISRITITSIRRLEKELLVQSQGKEERYPVMLMNWVDGDSPDVYQLKVEDMSSTEATDEELNEAITDEFGVKYSEDGRKLLQAPKELDGTYSIRKGTKIICDRAFWGCSSLRSIVIPDSVTSIGDMAFCGCWSLKSLVIPNSLSSIGNSVFSGCSSLESLVIPYCVVNLKGNSLYQWDGELKCQSPYFIYEDKVLVDKNKNAIIAFRDNDATSYVIPDSVTSIGDCAFEGCRSLSSLVIPDSVTRIGDSAFRGCTSLSSLVIPDSVNIGFETFRGCESLTDIIIHASSSGVANSVFKGCFFLSYIGHHVNIVLPDGITSIGDGAFTDRTSLSSLVIPDSVTSIGDGAFSGCTSLSSVVIPNSVTSIERGAFWGCTSLRNIVIPDSVTSIGDCAFWNCRSLTDIVIPDGVTSIEERAFIGCWSLRSVVIPDSVTSIGNCAFEGCRSLTDIVIPDGVTSIGGYAFSGCNFSYDLKQKLSSRFGKGIFEQSYGLFPNYYGE